MIRLIRTLTRHFRWPHSIAVASNDNMWAWGSGPDEIRMSLRRQWNELLSEKKGEKK